MKLIIVKLDPAHIGITNKTGIVVDRLSTTELESLLLTASTITLREKLLDLVKMSAQLDLLEGKPSLGLIISLPVLKPKEKGGDKID